MELVIELMKIVLPAAIVLYAMYLTVKAFLNKEMEQKWQELKMKNKETILPIRLQAYERICLFLERVHPNNLVLRLNDASYNAKELQALLLNEIREEYNHNLSQQVYMSDEAWNLTKTAMEEIILLINQASSGLTEENRGLDLAKRIFEILNDKKIDSHGYALTFIKDEVRQVY
jgi:hypothetical protein